ncbi:hypothetical protein D9757_003882 [Collybiopsis confluens]|uniref:NAD(P)-binding protein n=1 Tax=Collybiopsis confluens TaxID=2823264 RepID=A0A8H5HUX4_9AGAR|nr:hypothetical protein D9757_003882 [Collybiopsis confluens]
MALADSKGFAFITGSAQGMGKAIALRLARDGFDIALNDVLSKVEQLKEVEREVQAVVGDGGEGGRKTGVFPGDVSDEESVKDMIAQAVEHFGPRLDVFVANAGIVTVKSIIDTDVEEWDRALAVNARGTFLCYKYAAIQMVSQGRGGRIIGACSVSGKRGRPGGIAYCGTKFAIRGMTQVAALDLAKYNITVNAYAPGATDTPLLGEVFTDDTEGKKQWEFLGTIPLGRIGQPSDIANLVSYLASKDAGYITGMSILATKTCGNNGSRRDQQAKRTLFALRSVSTEGFTSTSTKIVRCTMQLWYTFELWIKDWKCK